MLSEFINYHLILSDSSVSAEKCLKMCGLETFADAIVGSLGVEQKKRTTIGVELAAKVNFFIIRRSAMLMLL